MSQIKLILESLSVLQLLVFCFSPLIPFLYYELISRLIDKHDDEDDDDNDDDFGSKKIFFYSIRKSI